MAKGMTDWGWFWEHDGMDAMAGEFKNKEDAIMDAERCLDSGCDYKVIEARMSTAKKYEGSDFVPFLRVRNGEDRIAGQ